MAAKKKVLTKSEKDALNTKINSLLWEQVVRGAQLPIDHKCIDRAIELGVLKNLQGNTDKLKSFGKQFDLTKACCLRAGKKAKSLADASRPKKKTIDPDTFEEAFNWVAKSYARGIKAKGGGLKSFTSACHR